MPNYIGPATPTQVVQIRQGRFTRYSSDNPGFTGPRTNPSGAGHQSWNEGEFPCGGRVGNFEGPHKNDNYLFPWQARWLPVTSYVALPNVLSVKTDKKLEIGGVSTATVEIENIAYPGTVGVGGKTWHKRERGYYSPLRGDTPPGKAPVQGEWGEIIPANEWHGRFAFVSQVTIYQGYGTSLAKVFTGLVEEADTTSHPDKIILTVRDFGQVFTDEHFFDWNIDPLIKRQVVFVDIQEASEEKKVGYNAHSSNEDLPDHAAKVVLRTDPSVADKASWQTNTVHSAEQTEYVEVALPEGSYAFADVHVQWGGMEAYLSLRAANRLEGPPLRDREGALTPMTKANKWLDANGWVDLTKKEEQIVPGVNGGNSYMVKYKSYPYGPERTPLDPEYSTIGSGAEGEGIGKEITSPVYYHVGKNSVLRISFRKLHKVEAGENYRAGVQEFHGLLEKVEEEGSLPGQEWVTVRDVADVVRIICIWAGFKEWDIEDTGIRLAHRLTTDPTKAYIDVIKEMAEAVGYSFYMADPSPDSPGSALENLGGSLGIPTFQKREVLWTQAERGIRVLEYAKREVANWSARRTQAEPFPEVLDSTLLTAINVKETNEALSYTIRAFGRTLSSPEDQSAAIAGGKRLEYTFRPPWAGDPTIKYADSRLAGVLRLTIHDDAYYSTEELVRNAAWLMALEEALASIEATIEIPLLPGLDVEDQVTLRDLGTGLSSNLLITSRSTTFTDGEKRKATMQLTGPLIDTQDIREMLEILRGQKTANGAGGEWASPQLGSGSAFGYG